MRSLEEMASTLVSEEFRAFLRERVYIAGLRLLWERHRLKPSFPFPDTKFNPNTGVSYPESSYNVLYTWVLGRGLEACVAHIKLLKETQTADDLNQIKGMLQKFIHSLTEALLQILEVNGGRCPFMVDRGFHAVDGKGKRVAVNTRERGPADLFCAKGLLASGQGKAMKVGKELLKEFIQASFSGRYLPDTPGAGPGDYTPFMLALGGIPLALGCAEDAAEERFWGRELAHLLEHLFVSFYDSNRSLLHSPGDPTVNPGHALEAVGLGLRAIEAARKSEAASESLGEEVERALREFPWLCLKTFAWGYNRIYGGIFQSVNIVRGVVVNPHMPWWSLPEAARAAIRAASVAEDKRIFVGLLEATCTALNAYFSFYLNPELLFFPFQTRDGRTGKVVDVHPAIPEGDPLYHANLSFLDMEKVLASPQWVRKAGSLSEG